MPKRPMTQREIEAVKETATRMVVIANICKQMIPIQLKSPLNSSGKRVDFFVGQRTVNLAPGQVDSFPEDQLLSEQITNLSKKGLIRVKKPR